MHAMKKYKTVSYINNKVTVFLMFQKHPKYKHFLILISLLMG